MIEFNMQPEIILFYKLVASFLIGYVLGLILASQGIGLFNWKYWAIMTLIALLFIVNTPTY